MAKHLLESTVRMEVEADSEESAVEVAKELMVSLNDTFADTLIYEWTNPVIYTDVLRKD